MLKLYRNVLMGLAVSCFTTAYAATDCNQVTEIPVSECQSLLELYNNTDGANWRNNNGWNEINTWNKTNTPCNWVGIYCEAGHVAYMSASYWYGEDYLPLGLKGQLPNLNLPYLKMLNLGNNQLSGNLPDFNLPNLQILKLYVNQFNGDIPNFSNLSNLQELYLSKNQLGNIPNFSNLPKLQYLDLSDNQLSGNIPNFNKLPKLRTLELSRNQLAGNIPDFSNLLNLDSILLEHNQLSGNIPNFDLPKLRRIVIIYNQLNGSIPNFNLPSLQILSLYSNQLSGDIPNFSNLPILEELELSNNLLSNTIPNFSKLPSLKTIYLSNNQLSGNIPDFSNLSRLRYIDVSSNQLSGNIPINLSDSINLTHNCGLVAYNSEQEGILDRYKPFGVLDWKAQNSDCSKATICPLVSVSPILNIHLPHLNYNNMTLSANLRYVPRDGKLLFEVIDYSVNSDSCASANLSPDFKLHIPTATFGDIKLWADFQLHSIENDKIIFELVKYGNA